MQTEVHTHPAIHLYTFTLWSESFFPFPLERDRKRWIRKLKNRKGRLEVEVCKKHGVCWRSQSSVVGWENTYCSETAGGRLQDGDGGFLFFAFAHSAYICLRDRKLILFPSCFFFLLLLVLFSCCSSLVPWGWVKEEALGGPVPPPGTLDTLNREPALLLP